MTELNGPSRWSGQIRAFSRDNAGRLALLETDAAGEAEVSPGSFRFLREIAFEPEPGRIRIVLGGVTTPDEVVTHTVLAPRAVHSVLAGDGRDAGLWIAGESGRTLLRMF